jgi:hypothetical protein
MRSFVPKGSGRALRNQVSLEFREARQHPKQHLAHAGPGIDALAAHVNQMQADSSLRPLFDVAQGICRAPK